MGPAESPARRLEVARTLAMDGVAVEVVTAFNEAGVRPILLKGPALARLLYPRELRSYVDVDLLVSGADVATAEAVLERLGFARGSIAIEPDLGLPHACPWGRADGANVDLHRTLAGVGVAPHEAWAALEGRSRPERIASIDVEVLDDPARALVVALHGSQHGTREVKPIEDLRRALLHLSEETWREAATLANALDAGIAFSSGLRLLPEGEALARRLGLPDAMLVDASRKVGSPTRLALGFDRLASTRGARGKLILIMRELAPSRDHMRWWSSLARRGPLGLAAAYAQRTLLFLWHTPPSLLAWRRLSRRPAPPVADGWYRLLDGARSPEEALRGLPGLRLLPQPLLDRLMGRSFTRGLLLFGISVRHPAIGVQREEPGWGTLLALRALFGRSRKLVSLQHIVHPRRHPLRRWLVAWDRWATRRALLRGHALSHADLEMLPRHYGLPAERFAYVPWPLAKRPPDELPADPADRNVLCAGRAYCDWPTLFAAARGSGWRLTVVCGRRDLRRVRRLNRDVGATVRSEIPAEEYSRLLGRASVSVVAMAEVQTSQGHIRVMDAGSNGVPLVASATRSIAEYVDPERTGLLVPPGDPVALREAVDRLLADRELAERLRREAYDRALRWQHYDYLNTLADLFHGRPVQLPPGAPGSEATSGPDLPRRVPLGPEVV